MALYGFWPVFIWYLFLSVAGAWFFSQEGPGLARVHGMVPLTWVLRCLPRIFWFVAAPVAVWHFAFVVTKTK